MTRSNVAVCALLFAALGLLGVQPSSADDQQPSLSDTTATVHGRKVPVANLRTATFNLLGASHTAKGSRAWMGTGRERMHDSVKILENNHISIVGFQEMQPSQVDEFKKIQGTRWGLYPGSTLSDRDGANSIAWRTDTWKLLKATTRPIPYFDGNIRNMPVLMMRHRATQATAWFFDVHNPTSNRSVGNNDKWRAEAVRREINAVKNLRAKSNLPVVLVGDFNDREKAFCPITRQVPMRAANGGYTTATRCVMPPRPHLVDWVFGTKDVRFWDYTAQRSDLVKTTTDHPVVISSATIPVRQWAKDKFEPTS